MKTVLLTWELGANLGHVGPLLRVAAEFRRRGYRPVLALRDVVAPRPLLEREEIEVLQAPRWPASAASARPSLPSGYADVLASVGFDDADGLFALVRSWEAMIAFVKPALVVADHSPTVCLTAYGTIPLAMVGDSYTMPPAHDKTFPPHHPRRRPLVDEARLLETVQHVQRRRGRPLPPTLPALFAAPVRAVATFPQLDCYRATRREPVMGPIEAMPAPKPMPLEPSLFAYLGDEHPQLETIVHGLLEHRGPVEVYLRGNVEGLRRLLASRGVRVHATPPPLSDVIARAAAIVSHAGSATAHAALAAGRPQVLFPTQAASELTTDALEDLGTGIGILDAADATSVAAAFAKACSSPELRANAAAHAERLAQRPPLDAVKATADACLSLLGAAA